MNTENPKADIEILKSEVALAACESYNEAKVLETLREICSSVEFPLVKGKTVFIKPNVLSASEPDKAVTTHPSVVKALTQLCFEKGAKVVLAGDSPAFQNAGKAAVKAGLVEAVETAGGKWVEFSETINVESKGAKLIKSFALAKEVMEADVIISVAKLKTHMFQYYTGAIKNLFGTIPGFEKSRFHMRFSSKADFASMLCDLYLAVNADFYVMDGITAMEGPGPGNGRPKTVNLLGASKSGVALDTICCQVMTYEPKTIPVLNEMYKRNIEVNDIDSITVKGSPLSDFTQKDFDKIKIAKEASGLEKRLPNWLFNGVKNLLLKRPFFSKKICIGCSGCVNICPAKALTLNKANKEKNLSPFISVDYNACIRCYCCHEICPVDAIEVKHFSFLK